MGWSLNIGSVAGTAVRIHVTFLLFLAWIFGVSDYRSRSTLARIVDAADRLIGLVTSETIGEMLMVHRAMPAGFRSGPWGRPAET